MPERSPSQNVSFLEPASPGQELLTTTDEQIELETRIAHEIDAPDGYVARKLGVAFWIALGWFGFVVALAVLAPVLPIKDPDAQYKLEPIVVDGKEQRTPIRPPFSTATIRQTAAEERAGKPTETVFFLLGSDALGRDVLARLIWGARVSLVVGFTAIALGLFIGSLIGLLSGYMKGWVDSVLMSAMDVILAFPALLLAMAIVGFTQAADSENTVAQSMVNISIALGVIAIPSIGRLVRANTMTFREREFVLAARTIGASHFRILAREILPNVIPPVVSFAVIGVAVAIAAESGLAFVGVSVPLPTSTWGRMIQEGANRLTDQPQLVFIPCIVLALTILALYLIGDKLRQRFDVKEGVL